MNICLILSVFAVVCLTSSDGRRSGSCQYLIFGLQASIESLEDQLRTCQLKVDGGWSEWNTWSTCSVTCGDGQQTRSRTCTNPAPANDGNDCVGETSESKSCNDGGCPIDGGWSEWNTWSTCSVTCGDGQQTRSRTCTNPAPENRGNDCDGKTSESKSCNDGGCPIDGGWSEWNTWSTCSVTCGHGQQTRSRTCTNPAPDNGGNDCDGKTSESKSCNDGGCPIDGGWSEWNTWSTCSVTCGHGQQTRSRTCTNPAPDNGGNDCDGKTSESKSCNDGGCPIDGGWSEWNTWSTCSVTCGDGQQTRSRTCTNPIPENGGNGCDGETSESKACNVGGCPIDGGWSEWNTWSTCSVTCGDGQQTRSRTCTNPIPENGGNGCDGETSESKACNDGGCPICGDLPEFEGGTLTVSSHAVGSVADVQCSDALYQYLGQNVTCLDSGEWTTADRNCDQIEFHDFIWNETKQVYQLPVNVSDGWSFELTATLKGNYIFLYFGNMNDAFVIDYSDDGTKEVATTNVQVLLQIPSGMFVKDVEFHLQVTFNTASIKFTVDGTDLGEITPPYDINAIYIIAYGDPSGNNVDPLEVRRMRYNY